MICSPKLKRSLLSCVVFLILSAIGLSASAYAEKPEINFERDIRPILENNCMYCHGNDERDGGLRFQSHQDLLLLNDSGEPAVAVGTSAESELIKRISAPDETRMPPADTADRLSDEEIALLKRWIDSGAHWSSTKEETQHWAYIKPIKANPPEVTLNAPIQNPIDAFILSKLEQSSVSLKPASPSDPARLMRRVYLDLTGLPPTPEEVDSFLTDPSDSAYEKIVDRLLASPRYGEKWTQHWLDMARYADSNGFQADQLRTMWLYRDWVINALNDDQPFDQFTVEQLAGDLLPNATWSQKVATGFHRCTTCNVEAGVDPEENRVNQIIDRVNTTSSVWLGTTLECAQCHNHKYDPFSQQDYYQLMAYFNNTPLEVEQEGDSVTFNFYGPKLAKPLSKIEQLKYDELKTERETLGENLEIIREEQKVQQEKWEEKKQGELTSKKNSKQELSSAEAKTLDTLNFPREKRSSQQNEYLQSYFEKQNTEISGLQKKLSDLDLELQQREPPTSLVMREQDEMRETFIFKRGDFLSRGKTVTPTTPAVLHPLNSAVDPVNVETGTRLEFANWLVSPENPLMARTTVNRWWAHFFGQGIVATLEDLGTQGEPPTHQELLDWLAVDFMENGWSRKHVHKRIVMSATYRQSTKVTNAHLQLDPENKLYPRGPRQRLSAESIRDNALAISGLLTHKLGGPPVYPPQPDKIWKHVGRNAPEYKIETDEDRYRRGLYVIWRRSAPYPSFINFDAPDRASCVISRSSTNTPLQALTLLNDPAYVEMAWGLADRLASTKTEGDLREKLTYGMRLAISREPSEDEINTLAELYQTELARYQENPKQAEERLPQSALKLTSLVDKTATPVELAAWFSIANILLNLDETITKG
ncbi:Planctomycete cytochrome C [Polystyrenella longa]|uniref:Planctomycete cytochrome C n=1 Tax=Polystyrenella longa TaxID=2528007 RepID=A0A518CH35_9PLAN|nr:PSD1 and planctomycete cytochrome C domain-containing protein [Polystyrenella longa]QDU78536.1 Planctomycete cytochrome C [Polystyrenella longa]